jgi:hypothetical protein
MAKARNQRQAPRRRRRGQDTPAATPPSPGSPATREARQLDPRAFADVDAMLGAFAHRQFGRLIPAVMAGFFGAATREERQNPELQSAFMLFFVYGWKDPDGKRLVDAFAAYGPALHGEQARVLGALRRARLRLFEVQTRGVDNKQLGGRDPLRDEPMALLDHRAFETLEAGDGLLAWCMGDALARPFGVATTVEARRMPALLTALRQLARELGMTATELADRRPAQTFWTVYRAANVPLH